MLTPEEKELYSRHLLIEGFTEQHQKQLANARIFVVGAGGLGTPVLLYLAAAGVGKLGIIEYDTISLSNLPRQIAYGRNEQGRNKTEIIREKLTFLNPSCLVEVFNTEWNDDNADKLIKKYDILIDCSDNLETRYLSDCISREFHIPMIYGAVHEFEGQMAVFNYKGSKGYSELFPEKDKQSTDQPVGVVGPLAGIIGSLQAAEAIKIVTGMGNVLINKLFIISLKHNRIQYIDF
jgi:molybdopterin/thiamine biosynthesis adenylyltransferase